MGGLGQFIWKINTSRQSSAPTSTPTNPFAVLSSLIDKNNTDRERDRERTGPRNKGSYNKGSIERDRYDRGNKKLIIRPTIINLRISKKVLTRELDHLKGQERTRRPAVVSRSAV